MIRRIGIFIFILLAVAFLAHAGAEEKKGIVDEFTGADWKRWDEVRKAFYVWGFRSGQNSAANTIMLTLDVEFYSEKGKSIRRRIGIDASIAQIVMGINTVYSDYRNMYLPLWEVCGYVIDSIGGFKDESYIQVLRKTYSRVPD
jgi:hypothetical protein